MFKLLKKLLSMVLSLVMLGAITTLCALFVIRNLLSGSTIVDLAIKTASVGSTGYTSILTEITGEEVYEDFSEYISEEELKENLEDFISSTLKYYSGVDGAEIPSIDNLKEQVYEASKVYEEKTGKKVNYEDIDKTFDKLDEGIANNVGVTNDEKVKKTFNFIYSDKVIMLAVIILICSLVLKLIIDRNILSLVKNIAVIALLNTLGNWGLGAVLQSMFKDNDNVRLVVDEIASTFNKIAIISVIIAIVFLVIWIVIKVMGKNKVSEEYVDYTEETLSTYSESNDFIEHNNQILESNSTEELQVDDGLNQITESYDNKK